MSAYRPTFHDSRDSMPPEAGITGAIDEIRATCVGVPFSPQAEALMDVNLLLGLAQAIGTDVTSIQRAITGRKKQSREYIEAWNKLDGLLGGVVKSFGTTETHYVGVRELSQRLNGLVTELYPPHLRSR